MCIFRTSGNAVSRLFSPLTKGSRSGSGENIRDPDRTGSPRGKNANDGQLHCISACSRTARVQKTSQFLHAKSGFNAVFFITLFKQANSPTQKLGSYQSVDKRRNVRPF